MSNNADLDEDAPTNSMGASSSTSGPVQTFDPLLKPTKVKRRLMPFKEFVAHDRRGN